MIRDIPSPDKFEVKLYVRHLKLFSLIWFNDNLIDNKSTNEKFCTIFEPCKIFQDVSLCQQYIENISKDNRLILIISNNLGTILVPFIHQFQQVSLIYIYCDDNDTKEQWTCEYSKVKPMVTKLDNLISIIHLDFNIHKQAEESSSNNTFTVSAGKSSLEVEGTFVFYQLLIDCLQRMKREERDTNELISYLKKNYEGNQKMLDNLQIFQSTYSADNAILWYSSQSFVYDTINTALRNQDIHMMFLCRSFLFDIYEQLHKSQLQEKIKVYRGQRISKDELETFKKNVGQLISANSFFSTSYDPVVADRFSDTQAMPGDMVAVFFEIEADPLMMIDTKPFADITKYSRFPDEKEVLFMFGSIFRVNSVDHEEGPKWTIRMSLCDDDDKNVQEVLQHMQKQNGKGETNLQTLAKLVWKMGHLDLAEKYYDRFLKDLSPNDSLLSKVYEDLAEINSQKQDYNRSLEWKQKSLELLQSEKASYGEESRIRTIRSDARWTKNGVTIAGGSGLGSELHKLYLPNGLVVDDDRTVYIADSWNNRIVAWKPNTEKGCVVAGGKGNKNMSEELFRPSDVAIDRKNDSFIICDNGKRRVVRCSRQNNTSCIETILHNILSWGLALVEKNLYVTDIEKHEVRRYREGEKMALGVIVAGGNGQGTDDNQLNTPLYVFVDSEDTVYVSDHENHRVMKWEKDAKEGILVAGGRGLGQDLAHLCYPTGLVVDKQGTIYIVDSGNHRVVRWYKDAKEGELIAGGRGPGERDYQFNEPQTLFFDKLGNLYVTDKNNHRVQRFDIQ